MKKTPIKRKSKSETALTKDDIQTYVRLIVTIRDGGCILRNKRCGVTATVQDDKVVSDAVIQADHLVTRANGATYADTRLIVCVCKGCHGWKHWNEDEYNALVRTILPQDRVELWDRAMADRHAHKTYKMDWTLELLNLKNEYKKLSTT